MPDNLFPQWTAILAVETALLRVVQQGEQEDDGQNAQNRPEQAS
jgi:hypothetical protein